MEKGPPDKPQEYTICARDCEPGKQKFDTHEEAARSIIAQVLDRSVEIDKEVCGLICQDNFSGKYFLAKETWWLSTGCIPGYKQCPSCGQPAAWWHTHGAPESFLFPGRAEYFSPEDMGATNETGLPGYLGTPQGSFMFYSPGAPRATYLGSFK